MMALVFGTLLLAALLHLTRWRGTALFVLFVCLGLAVAEFLWEIHSPDYGFRLPWLQVRLAITATA
jgi:hypothetical protein